MKSDVVDNIRRIEHDQIKGDRPSDQYFGYAKGTIPILISAPHGAKHYRSTENRWKAQDSYTSSFAIMLGRLTGAHVIYVKNKTSEDPNNDVQSRYKDFLKKIVAEKSIRFVMDLHGAGWNEPFKIDVGTISNNEEASSCPTFHPVIARALQDFDDNPFNKKFTARGCATITSFARVELGIESAQFEINARYRMIGSSSSSISFNRERDVLDMLSRLRRIVLGINDRLTKGI